MKRIVEVSYGRTINLGNFENVKIQAGIAEEISDKDKRSHQQVFDDLFMKCEGFVLEKGGIEVEPEMKTKQRKRKKDTGIR
jgi:hypothetical protein